MRNFWNLQNLTGERALRNHPPHSTHGESEIQGEEGSLSKITQ